MSEALHQISSPVPFIVFLRIALINAGFKVKRAPDINKRAEIEGKANLARRIYLLNGWEGLKVGENSIGVFTCYFCVLGVRECRIQRGVTRSFTIVQRPP